jgi:hypothetical protein
VINSILRALFVRRAPSLQSGETDLLNYALDLAQEWGKNWLRPIQPRLRKAYPQLPNTELDRLNDVVQRAMKSGHDLVYSMAEAAEESGATLVDADWRRAFSLQYPWVDERNLRHLFSTGSYYAWKDGVGVRAGK